MRRRKTDHSILSAEEWKGLGRALKLSPRELDLVRACFDDLSEARMADALGISQHTIHTYIKRLYRKVGVGSRVELVLRCMSEILGQEREAGSG